MKKSNKKNRIELEKVCINCNYFFSYLREPSEYGICLNDSIFDPYIEELLENENYDSCKELIEKKKFDGNVDCCKDFEMVKIITDELSLDELKEIDSCNEHKLMDVHDNGLPKYLSF